MGTRSRWVLRFIGDVWGEEEEALPVRGASCPECRKAICSQRPWGPAHFPRPVSVGRGRHRLIQRSKAACPEGGAPCIF